LTGHDIEKERKKKDEYKLSLRVRILS
jgi:hypothetical protein